MLDPFSLLQLPYTAWSEWRSWRQGRRLNDVEAKLAIERTYALLREHCFYYASLVSRGINQPSFPARQQILNQIHELYLDVVKLRQTNPALTADPWYDIEKHWGIAISGWIQDHNQETSDLSVTAFTVEPLPSMSSAP